MTLSELLNTAAEFVEAGWTQGVYRNGNRFCCVGAIFTAAKIAGDEEGITDIFDLARMTRETEEAALKVVARTIKPRAKDYRGNIVLWNDEPERTQDEVVALLRSCAEKVK
jgi:hypothetical protein